MSILNIWPSADRVLMGSDTGFALRSGLVDTAHASAVPKVLPLAHLGAEVAGRGHLGFIVCAWQMAALGRHERFDDLLADLPKLYRESALAATAVLTGQGLATPTSWGELAVVGYSDKRRRMVAVIALAQPDQPPECLELTGPWLTPSDGAFYDAYEPTAMPTDEQALGLMRHQAQEFRTPDMPALGGKLVLCRVSPGRVVVEVRGCS